MKKFILHEVLPFAAVSIIWAVIDITVPMFSPDDGATGVILLIALLLPIPAAASAMYEYREHYSDWRDKLGHVPLLYPAALVLLTAIIRIFPKSAVSFSLTVGMWTMLPAAVIYMVFTLIYSVWHDNFRKEN